MNIKIILIFCILFLNNLMIQSRQIPLLGNDNSTWTPIGLLKQTYEFARNYLSA